jgi:hypothetical protein
MGAGQFDFGVLARQRGASVLGIDNDPAVLELGTHKGFATQQVQLRRLDARHLPGPFDGLFCKFSLNAFWASGPTEHRAQIHEIASLLKTDGWAWIAPWNGPPKRVPLSPDDISQTLQVQADEFARHGFLGFALTDALAKYYGVHGATGNNALFVRNLPCPMSVATCEPLSRATREY